MTSGTIVALSVCMPMQTLQPSYIWLQEYVNAMVSALHMPSTLQFATNAYTRLQEVFETPPSTLFKTEEGSNINIITNSCRS